MKIDKNDGEMKFIHIQETYLIAFGLQSTKLWSGAAMQQKHANQILLYKIGNQI